MTATSSSGLNSSRPVTPGNDPYAEAQAHVAGIDTEGAPHEYGETERYGGIPMSKMMSEKDYRNQ